MLEARDVPSAASFYWIGTNANDYYSSSSWAANGADHTVPISGDELYFGASVPTTGVSLLGGPPSTAPAPSNVDCIIPTAFSFTGVHLVSGYSGTVTVQDETAIGNLELRNGAISQAGSSSTGYDLYVTQTMNFTGGTLNSSANTGIVHLQGVTGLIGATGVTVTTGSTLNVESGTTLSYGDGIIGFANSATLETFENTNFIPQNPDTEQQGQFINIIPQQQFINGPIIFRGGVTLKESSDKPILVIGGGELRITKSISIDGHVSNQENSASLGMLAGKIRVDSGVTLTVVNGYSMSGGTFETRMVLGLAEQKVTIVGTIAISNGTIKPCSDNGTGNYGKIAVQGNVIFTGGEYLATVDGSENSTAGTRWTCTGIFSTSCDARITVAVAHELQAGVATGRTWTVIVADGGFLDGNQPVTVAGWDLGLFNNGKELVLRKLSSSE